MKLLILTIMAMSISCFEKTTYKMFENKTIEEKKQYMGLHPDFL